MDIFLFSNQRDNLRVDLLGKLAQMALVVLGLTLATQSASAQLFPTYINGSFTLGNTGGSSPYSLGDTFFLETNPGASKTIYLDFDGHHSVDNRWNHDIELPAFNRSGDASTFSNSELIEIQRQFQNVAEDFIGFDVNVTTRDPGVEALRKTNSDDQVYGIRSVNTQATSGFGNGIGGVAYLNSFDDNRDNPVFAFNKGANNGGMTNSHEIGHALGLSHDGLGSNNYHPGTGSGSTGWGPLMGAPFGKNLTQWSNGDYTGSTTSQDDLAIITKSANGVNYRADDFGDSLATAQNVAIDGSGDAFIWGIIEQNTDVDFFEFELGRGEFSLAINPFQGRPNLDVLATLYDSNGDIIETSDPFNELDANFLFNIDSADSYFVSIEGTGKSGVYSDYGSLGFFTVTGSFTAVPEPASIGLWGVIAVMMLRRRRSDAIASV